MFNNVYQMIIFITTLISLILLLNKYLMFSLIEYFNVSRENYKLLDDDYENQLCYENKLRYENKLCYENQLVKSSNKNVKYYSTTFFDQRGFIKKTKSLNNINNFNDNKLLYSNTYYNLNKIIPPNSPSKIILHELIKNKNNNILACCNPYCRKDITELKYIAFDGYYCTETCRYYVVENMYAYWKQIY